MFSPKVFYIQEFFLWPNITRYLYFLSVCVKQLFLFICFHLGLEDVSPQHLLMTVDERINHQKLCHQYGNPTKESQPLCNTTFCEQTSIMREAMNIVYLKPRQFDLLFNGPLKLIIEGPAGTGKTLIILLKILYLVKSETIFNIVLFVPFPYNICCFNLLKENNVDIRSEDTFPIKPLDVSDRKQPSQPIVRVVDLNKFHKNCWEYSGLNRMDPLHEHVFVDDLQAIDDVLGMSKEYSETLRRLGEICTPDTYTWFALDLVQGGAFFTALRDDIQDHFSDITIAEVQENLRNSGPIQEAVNAQYSAYLSEEKAIPPFKMGHTISGPPIDCYLLTELPSRDDYDDLNLPIQRRYLIKTLEQIITNDFPDVPTAVTPIDDINSDIYELCSLILQKICGKEVIDIKKYYDQGSQLLMPSQIILDKVRNLASFEIPLLISVSRVAYPGSQYMVSARARAKHIHIQLYYSSSERMEIDNLYPKAHITISKASDYESQ